MDARCVVWLAVVVAGLSVATGCDRNGGETKGAAEAPAVRRATRVAAADEKASKDPPPQAPTPKKSAVDPVFWQERDAAELEEAIAEARKEAAGKDGRVLLAFVASWCPDSRQVAEVLHEDPAAGVIAERYALVPVHVGRFDRHEALLERHGVDRIATLIVTSPGGEPLARKVLEPVSTRSPLASEALAEWLRSPGD